MVSACDPTASTSLPYLEACTSPTVGSNLYREASQQYPGEPIFAEAFRTGQPYSDMEMRRRALYTLKDEVRRWSSFQDMLVNDNQVVRITLTFIHPDLVEIILLNHSLAQPSNINRDQFANELKIQLGKLADYNELFFLVTVTDSSYKPLITEKDVVVLSIPARDITLMNSKKEYVAPSHYDPPLGQNIQISRKHLSGYVAFPMFVKDKNDQCVLMLEPPSNTTITVGATNIKLSTTSGNVSNHQLTWFIRYHSLLDINIVPTPAIVSDQNIAPECCHAPPTPDIAKLPTDEEYWNSYWVEIARYVWGYVVAP